MLLLGCCFLGFSACGVVVTFVVWGSFVVFGFLVLLIGLLFLFLLMVLMLYGFFSSGGSASLRRQRFLALCVQGVYTVRPHHVSFLFIFILTGAASAGSSSRFL